MPKNIVSICNEGNEYAVERGDFDEQEANLVTTLARGLELAPEQGNHVMQVARAVSEKWQNIYRCKISEGCENPLEISEAMKNLIESIIPGFFSLSRKLDVEDVRDFQLIDYVSLFVYLFRSSLLRALDFKAKPFLLRELEVNTGVTETGGDVAFGALLYADMLNVTALVSKDYKKNGLDFADVDWYPQYPGSAMEFRKLIKDLQDNWDTYTAGEPKYEDYYTKLPDGLKGVGGYIAFAQVNMGSNANMIKAYVKMSAACKAAGLNFSELQWPSSYRGSLIEFKEGIEGLKKNWNRYISAEPKPSDNYTELPKGLKGVWGCIAYTEVTLGEGADVEKGRAKLRALCTALNLDFKELAWPYVRGVPAQCRQDMLDLNDNWDGYVSGKPEQRDCYTNLPDRLKGIWGYISYTEATLGPNGSMGNAFDNMSALCVACGLDMAELEWPQYFKGTVAEYRLAVQDLRGHWDGYISAEPEPSDNYVELPKGLKGVLGYIAYTEATLGVNGSMGNAFDRMSAMCDAAGLDFNLLGWPNRYSGSVKELRKEIVVGPSILESSIEEFFGVQGYMDYVEKTLGKEGNMDVGFSKMSAKCKATGVDFKSLGWPGAYVGSLAEFKRELANCEASWSSYIADQPDERGFYSVMPRGLRSSRGYLAYVEANLGRNGSMMVGYKNMGVVCRSLNLDFKKLGWPSVFTGSALEYRNGIIDLQNNWDKYVGQSGYLAYAEEKYGASTNMSKVFQNAFSLCIAAGIDFKKLGWVLFVGSFQQFQSDGLQLQAQKNRRVKMDPFDQERLLRFRKGEEGA